MEIYEQIYIQKLETSTVKDRYLLIYNGLYYEASAPVVELLLCLQEEKNMDEAITSYIKKKNRIFSYTEIEEIIAKYISPILKKTTQPSKKTFLYEREVFSATAIDKFSNACRFLFHIKWMCLFIVVALALDIYFFLSEENLVNFGGAANAYLIVGLLLFMLVSSLFHELGHASACKYFNIRHGGIGFGLYLNIPVLYTDVTEVWRLNRNKRCIVNIAGVYFQMYILFVLLILYLLTRYDLIRYMILIINLGFIMTLNPFFKFDGYWIASDLLGIPNLRKRSKELLVYWYNRIRSGSQKESPYLLQTNKLGRYGLLIYTLIVNLFMGFYFCYILPQFIIRFIHSFPDEVHQLVLYLSNGIAPSFALLRNISMQLLLLALIGIFIVNLIKSLFKYAGQKQR